MPAFPKKNARSFGVVERLEDGEIVWVEGIGAAHECSFGAGLTRADELINRVGRT